MIKIVFLSCCSISLGLLFQSHIDWIQSHPVFAHQSIIFNTNNVTSNNNLRQIAKTDHVHQIPSWHDIETNIRQKGDIYGWLNVLGFLKPTHYYIMHFTYYSQLYPVYAPDACEAVSLRMALSAKGFHIPVSTRTFINRIPRSKNPNKGYTQNPYKYGDSATINPKGLIKYARRYNAKVKDLTGASKGTFIKNMKKGNPIVFEGAYQMRKSSSDHVLLMVGYRKGHPSQFLIADPFQRKSQNNRVFWVSTSHFMKIYKDTPLRQEHALTVIGRLPKERHNKHKKHHKRHINGHPHNPVLRYQHTYIKPQNNFELSHPIYYSSTKLWNKITYRNKATSLIKRHPIKSIKYHKNMPIKKSPTRTKRDITPKVKKQPVIKSPKHKEIIKHFVKHSRQEDVQHAK